MIGLPCDPRGPLSATVLTSSVRPRNRKPQRGGGGSSEPRRARGVTSSADHALAGRTLPDDGGEERREMKKSKGGRPREDACLHVWVLMIGLGGSWA